MTNTLHRYGKAETFVDDYIVFSLPAKSKAAGQTGDALAAQKRFMTIAAQYHPVSLGDALHGGALRPTKSNSIFGHWGKRNRPNLKKVLDGMTKAGTIDEKLASALPKAPEKTVVPTEKQSTDAGTLLGEKWAAAIQ